MQAGGAEQGRAAELISNLNTTTVRSADDEMSPLILIVRTLGNLSCESLINSDYNSPQNRPSEKDQLKKELKKINSLLRKQNRGTGGGGFNTLQKKLLMKQ